MNAAEMRRRWQERSEVAFGEVTQWREEHPKATLAEIEEVIDGKILALRAAMIQETALARATPVSPALSPPLCEECGHPLQARGRHRRTLQTQGGQAVTLERDYLTCAHCGNGFFPAFIRNGTYQQSACCLMLIKPWCVWERSCLFDKPLSNCRRYLAYR